MIRFRIIWAVFFLMAAPVVCMAQSGRISQEQKNQLKSLMAQSQQQMQGKHQEMRNLRRQLQQVYSQYKLDESRASALRRQINDVQLDVLKIHLDNEIKIRSVLDEQGFKRFRSMLDKKKGKGNMGGNMHGSEQQGPQINLPKDVERKVDKKKLSQLENSIKKAVGDLRQSSKDMMELYQNYNLNRSDAEKAVNKAHRSQVELSNIVFKMQKFLRDNLSEEDFNKIQTGKKGRGNGHGFGGGGYRGSN